MGHLKPGRTPHNYLTATNFVLNPFGYLKFSSCIEKALSLTKVSSCYGLRLFHPGSPYKPRPALRRKEHRPYRHPLRPPNVCESTCRPFCVMVQVVSSAANRPQGSGMNARTDTLIPALKEVFLNRLAHLQQYALEVYLVIALHRAHGQFHHHERRSIPIIFHRTLATDPRRRFRHFFDLPTFRPGHYWRIGASNASQRKHAQQDEQQVTKSNHCNGHSRIKR